VVVQRTLCSCGEVYFIEPEIVKILEELRQAMRQLSLAIQARNDLTLNYYDNVCPRFIATS